MSSPILGLIGVGVAALYGIWSWLSSDDHQAKRGIEEMSRTPIRDAEPGTTAKLVGRIVYAGEPVSAPLSGRPCAYYQVIVEEYRARDDLTESPWFEIIRDEGGVDFLIEDSTGRARVDNRSLQVHAIPDRKLASGPFRDAPPDMDAFLEKHGRKSEPKNLRYREAVFEAGETVAIVGEVGLEADAEAEPQAQGYRDAPRRVVIRAPEGGRLLASDDPSVL